MPMFPEPSKAKEWWKCIPWFFPFLGRESVRSANRKISENENYLIKIYNSGYPWGPSVSGNSKTNCTCT